jgi:hypothetical protein
MDAADTADNVGRQADEGSVAEYVVGCVAAVGAAITLARILISPGMYTTLWHILEKAIPWM